MNNYLIISTVFGLITPIIGIISILKGSYKPHRFTRLILLIINSIIFGSLFALGDTQAIYLAGVELASGLVIFGLCFRYGIGGNTKFDFGLLCLALFTIVLWRITDNPVIALLFSILVDLIGMLPTVIKCLKNPFTEEPWLYVTSFLAGSFSVLAMTDLTLTKIIFPIYILAINLLCFSFILTGQKLQPQQKIIIPTPL